MLLHTISLAASIENGWVYGLMNRRKVLEVQSPEGQQRDIPSITIHLLPLTEVKPNSMIQVLPSNSTCLFFASDFKLRLM